MFYVYAIRSTIRNYTYIGLSNNLERRINEHNSGYNKTTKSYAPFLLIYQKEYSSRPKAREAEKYLKSSAGREFLKRIL